MIFLRKNNQKGQLLVEALLAITIIGILASFVISLVNIGVRTNQFSGKQSVALALAQEALVAVRTIKNTNDASSRGWNKIYEINELLDYYPDSSTAVWLLATGSEEVIIDGITYTRKINFDIDINRDLPNGGGDIVVFGIADPSTIRVKVTVTVVGIPDIILEEHLTRSQNETKLWNTDAIDDPSSGVGFKSAGAICADTKILGTGIDASVELTSGSNC